MDSLFNKLYNNILKEENINEEICNICHYKTLNDKIILSCKHVFHKKCLKNLKNCPYCGKKIEKPPLEKPIIEKPPIEKQINIICKVILKSGKNKGKECGRKNCLIHKNIPIKNICKVILKSGKNKGKECGRGNCLIHKNNINI